MNGHVDMLAPIVGSAVCVAAGCAVFLVLFNRVLLHIPDSRLKSVILVSFLTAATVGGTLLGWRIGLSVWLALPLAVLLALAAGEIHRLTVRHRCRAEGPVETRQVGTPLHRPFTTCKLAYRRYEVTCLPTGYERLRVAHISDLHVNDRLASDYYREVVDLASESKPDLVFITGDFVSEAKFTDLLPDILTRLHARFGVFAVLGNHDYWAEAETVRTAIAESGITYLGNGHQAVELGNGHCVVVAGCETPWGDRPWTPPPCSPDIPTLALAHTPDNIYALRDAGATAVFAGHYHGGQAVVPGLGALTVPSKYGRRFDHGHFRLVPSPGKPGLSVSETSASPQAVRSLLARPEPACPPCGTRGAGRHSHVPLREARSGERRSVREPAANEMLVGNSGPGGTHLFVTSGVGVHSPPFRIYCQPEVVVVDLL